MNDEDVRRTRIAAVIVVYPLVLVLVATALNLFAFGVKPIVVALPSPQVVVALTVSAVLLIGNHAWLMTSTELTRLRFRLAATPEERAAQGGNRPDTPALARDELERRHNAHRNTTENVVYFVLLVLVFAFVSPPPLAVQVWAIGFAAARLGYTASYLAGSTGARGFFMSLGLLALFGMAGYLAVGALP